LPYFYHNSKIYWNLSSFCRDNDLIYEGVRYFARKFGTKDLFMKHLHENNEVIDLLIQRYKKKEQP
jgi:hypothetical protein